MSLKYILAGAAAVIFGSTLGQFAISFNPTPALAQNTTCSDRPPTDSSNACANTRFVSRATSATISPDGLGTPACVRNGTTNCTSGVVAAAAAANAAGVPMRLLTGGGYCITPIQFGGASPPAGMTLAALPYGIVTESAKAAFVSCSTVPTGTAMVRIVNYLAGNTINQNFNIGPLLIDGGVNTSYALEIYGTVFSDILATLRGGSVASFYVHADTNHVIINNSWNITFDTQTPAISALMTTTDGAANGIAIAANQCIIRAPFGTAAGDVVQTDYMNGGCQVDAESSGTGYGVNLGHTTNGIWSVYTEGNSLGGINGAANSKGVQIYGSSQDGITTTLKTCVTCVIDVWNLTATTQVRNLGDAVSQSIYMQGIPGIPNPISGQGWVGAGPTNGLAIAGNGSAYDVSALTSAAAVGCGLVHNALIWDCGTGYRIGGLAPSNHILLGNGTNYVDSATIPASILSGTVPCVNLPALTGDITTSAGNCATTLATVNANVGTFGSATSCVTVTTNAKGLITAISAATCTPAFSSITGQATLAQFPNMAANTALVNATAGSAVPTAFAMPSCSTAASALIWTTSTGYGCNTAITASTMPTTGLTGTLQAAQEPAHTGDVTNTAGSLAMTLAAGNAGNLNSGTLLAARMPALTGDVTTSAGAVATTIAANAVTNAKMATMVTNTVKGNATSGTAVPTDLTMTSCSTAASAVIWTTNTGFGCNTSITANTATTATTATNATNTAVTDDTTTNATMYPTWVTTTTGNLPQKLSSTKLTFNPSTGNLFATQLTIANGSTTQGLTFQASGGAADALIYEGSGGSLGIKMGTANGLNITKNDNTSVIDYAIANAGAVTITPALLYWANSTADTAATDASVCRRTSNGQLLTGTGATGICLGTSSARYKHDIIPMVAGLADIVKLSPVNFHYNKGHVDDGKFRQYGFTAEDVVKVNPDLVRLDETKRPNSVDMLAMVPILVKAVQELKVDNDNLRADIKAIRSQK